MSFVVVNIVLLVRFFSYFLTPHIKCEEKHNYYLIIIINATNFLCFSAQWAVACLMGLGEVVELCVSAVTIINYCAQCELLLFYLREIGLRMEEKTKDLNIIMKVFTTKHILPQLLVIWQSDWLICHC